MCVVRAQEMVDSLSVMSRDELTELVRYHVVPSRVTGRQLHNDLRLTTLSTDDQKLLVKRHHSVRPLSLFQARSQEGTRGRRPSEIMLAPPLS